MLITSNGTRQSQLPKALRLWRNNRKGGWSRFHSLWVGDHRAIGGRWGNRYRQWIWGKWLYGLIGYKWRDTSICEGIDEEFEVGVAYAVVYPLAMVVHLEDAVLTGFAVVAPRRLAYIVGIGLLWTWRSTCRTSSPSCRLVLFSRPGWAPIWFGLRCRTHSRSRNQLLFGKWPRLTPS